MPLIVEGRRVAIGAVGEHDGRAALKIEQIEQEEAGVVKEGQEIIEAGPADNAFTRRNFGLIADIPCACRSKSAAPR